MHAFILDDWEEDALQEQFCDERVWAEANVLNCVDRLAREAKEEIAYMANRSKLRTDIVARHVGMLGALSATALLVAVNKFMPETF